MLTPARRETATRTSLKSHITAPSTALRLRVDGPGAIPGPHVHRSLQEPVRQPAGIAAANPSVAELPSDSTLGFLTIAELAGNGFVGGYLVTNLWGRPLEFQCTAPVKPNRAQEILYGPTLCPVLFGELIAAALIDKAKARPLLVLTDQRDVLAARPHVKVPVVYFDPRVIADSSVPYGDESSADPDIGQPYPWRKDPRPAHCCRRFEHDAQALDALLRCRERLQDLHEPFERIHLCIEEVYP